MTLRRPRPAPWLVAAAIGLASISYFIRTQRPEAWAGRRPGVWDLTASVVTNPRFTLIVCFTSMLVYSAVRRDAVLPELMAIGSWRGRLAREGRAAVLAVLPSAVAVLAVCLLGAALVGAPWLSLNVPGTASAALADAGLPGPVGVLGQILLVMLTLTVTHVALSALRIAFDSVVPVVLGALSLFCWSSVSVLALAMTIGPGQSLAQAASFAETIDGTVAAALNGAAYLDLVVALPAGLHIVVAGLGAVTAAAFGVVVAMDLRIALSRRPVPHPALQPR